MPLRTNVTKDFNEKINWFFYLTKRHIIIILIIIINDVIVLAAGLALVESELFLGCFNHF